jgi:quercetin dioxygenase-like cupin family protein
MNFARVLGLYNDVTDAWLPRPGRPEYEQRRLVIEPGAEHPSGADAWADALVVVESGRLEVECVAGARRTFQATAMLCLGWLPLRALRNTGAEPAVLVAIRRRREQPPQPPAGTYDGR